MSQKIEVEIVRQPTLVERFRYKSECKSKHPESTLGKHSRTLSQKTYPTIRILNYTGQVTVVVSCVTAEKPYRQHPNILVGEDCRRGVCTVSYKTDASNPTEYTFKYMAIQCSKKSDILKILSEREKCNVDPFKAGFEHKNVKAFRSAVRLCFQVFVRSSDGSTKLKPVFPIVSDIIRSRNNLEIRDISDTECPVTGNKKIVIFCSKVKKGDIGIRFYREDENEVVQWEAWAPEPIIVHRQVAIVFKTPAYATPADVSEPIDVLLELVRPSDGKRSEPPHSFRYVPDPLNIDNLTKKKEQKITRSDALFMFIEQSKDEKRKLAIQNPDAPVQPLTTQSTFSHYNQAPNNHTDQQTHFENRAFSHNDIQIRDAQNVYNNFSQPALQINQPYHSHHHHSQFQLQPQNIQSTDGAQMQSHNAINPSHSQLHEQNIQPEFQQMQSHYGQTGCEVYQPDYNSYYQQQQLQQQYYDQSYFHPMPANSGYGGKYLSSAATYRPIPNGTCE